MTNRPPRRTLEPVRIFDWYDGIVLSLARVSWREGTFLTSLLYHHAGERLTVYALLELSPNDVGRILASSKDWARLEADVAELFARPRQVVTLVCVGGSRDEVIAEAQVPASRVFEQAVSDISEVILPERAAWLRELGVDSP